jgi:hypothetical protein
VAGEVIRRALALSGLLNIALGAIAFIWLGTCGDPAPSQRVEELTRGYKDSLRLTRAAEGRRTPAIARFRTLRDTLEITDTVQVRELIERADTVIALDSVVIARKDAEIAQLQAIIAAQKPNRVTPWVEALWNPYSKDWRARGGIDVRAVRRVSLVVGAEADRDGPRALIGGRISF